MENLVQRQIVPIIWVSVHKATKIIGEDEWIRSCSNIMLSQTDAYVILPKDTMGTPSRERHQIERLMKLETISQKSGTG